MKTRLLLLILFLTASAPAQSNVYSVRVIGHTPDYERIFLPKRHILRPSTLRGLDDLGPAVQFPETNRIDRLFADPSRERTNGLSASCLPEVPLNDLSARMPADLISMPQAQELLRNAVAVRRSVWTNHLYGTGARYVFSLVSSNSQSYVIDLRPGSFALVFFPDDTYRCIVGPGYDFLSQPPPASPANGQ